MDEHIRPYRETDAADVVQPPGSTIRRHGEISMLAVDPDHRRRGLGAALTDVATDWIREPGLPLPSSRPVATTGTHLLVASTKRRGFIPMPIVRYLKALWSPTPGDAS